MRARHALLCRENRQECGAAVSLRHLRAADLGVPGPWALRAEVAGGQQGQPGPFGRRRTDPRRGRPEGPARTSAGHERAEGPEMKEPAGFGGEGKPREMFFSSHLAAGQRQPEPGVPRLPSRPVSSRAARRLCRVCWRRAPAGRVRISIKKKKSLKHFFFMGG